MSRSPGFSTEETPRAAAGSARLEGLTIGRDMRASPGRGQAIPGDTDATAESGATATHIANIETGERRHDMVWRGMAA